MPLLMVVVSHRWKVLLATLASKMSRRWTRARSPRGLPRFRRTTSFSPHTLVTIFGVRASAPSSRRERRASRRARVRLSSGSSRAKTAVRLEIATKSSRSMLSREHSLGSVPCCLPGLRPKTSRANMQNSSLSMWQLEPQMASSSVLPLGVPPSPTVEAVVLVVKAFVRRTRL